MQRATVRTTRGNNEAPAHSRGAQGRSRIRHRPPTPRAACASHTGGGCSNTRHTRGTQAASCCTNPLTYPPSAADSLSSVPAAVSTTVMRSGWQKPQREKAYTCVGASCGQLRAQGEAPAAGRRPIGDLCRSACWGRKHQTKHQTCTAPDTSALRSSLPYRSSPRLRYSRPRTCLVWRRYASPLPARVNRRGRTPRHVRWARRHRQA